MTFIPNIERLRSEGHDQVRRFEIISGLARHELESSALVAVRGFEAEDVNAVRNFLLKASPYVGNKLYPNYWEHILLTSIYARVFGEFIPSINPFEVESLGLLHDVGRLVVPHRYYRNDVIGKALERHAGIREDFSAGMEPLDSILGMRDSIKGVKDLSLAQAVILVSDNLGRVNSTGQLIMLEDVLGLSSGSRYTDPVWPSERSALSLLNSEGKEAWANRLVYETALALFAQYGVHFDSLRVTVEAEFNKPENQRWIQAAQDAQETLNTDVDQTLDRPPIKYIIFDIGGVLLRASEQELVASVAAKLEIDPIKTFEALQRYYLPEVMSGRVGLDEQTAIISAATGIKIGVEKLMNVFNNPQIYHPVEGMQLLVEMLSQNPVLEIVLFTDSIRPVADPIRRAILSFYPYIGREKIVISSEAGVSKVGGDAYPFMLEKIGNPDPQSVLFVDDRQIYATRARSGFNMRGFTFRDNPFEGNSAGNRLRNELKSAGLIS